MTGVFHTLFRTDGFLPHGQCYLWNTGVIGLHLLGDTLIVLAYYAIPFLLGYFVRKRQDIPFHNVFWLFSLFILGCGTTHLLEIWTLWTPAYWLAGIVKVATGMVSIATAVVLLPTLPRALALRSPLELERLNRALEQEVAEHKQTAAALQEQLATSYRQAQLLDLAYDGIFVRDMQSTIIFWNHGAEDLYGWTKEEAGGKASYLLLQTVFPKPREEIEADILSRGHWEGDLVHTRRDGAKITVASRWALQRDKEGQPQAILEINTDVTESKRMEEVLRTLNAELEQKVAERTAALQRSNDELQQFAYIVSHDFQEPLRTVGSYVQLLARRYQGKLDADADLYISLAADGVRRMQNLLTDLLAYTRIGGASQEFTSVDCEAILTHVLEDLQAASAASAATVTHEPLPSVHGDATHLGLVFQNLISNALKFHGDAPPRIHVSARREGAFWRFSIQDNGIGIDPAQAGRIFQVFQRLHARDKYGGAGIGLAICKKIVERHGGRIWVESQSGQGSTFFFTLFATEAERKLVNA